MKKVFLLIFVPALLVALGFAQTPTANINTDQTNIKGCLGGTDGNYTVVEDGTGHIFKITTSSVNLNPHLGHEVNLTGHSASGVSSAAADNSFTVTELNMISEHCAAAAAVPAATVSTSSETASTPAAPAEPTSTPAETAAIPAVAAAATSTSVSATSETAVVPAAAPALTVSTPTDTAVIPSVAAAESGTTVSATSNTVRSARTAATHATQPAARPRIPQATTATAAAPAAAATPAEPVSTPAEADGTPTATVTATSETPAPDAMKPAKTARGSSLWLLISFVVLVLIIGALAPLASRWRKRRILEKLGPQNLSFTHEAPTDQSKGDEPVVRKIA